MSVTVNRTDDPIRVTEEKRALAIGYHVSATPSLLLLNHCTDLAATGMITVGLGSHAA
jgi:hypothetical protein